MSRLEMKDIKYTCPKCSHETKFQSAPFFVTCSECGTIILPPNLVHAEMIFEFEHDDHTVSGLLDD